MRQTAQDSGPGIADNLTVAVYPQPDPTLEHAVRKSGAHLGALDTARVLVWSSVGDTELLKSVLRPQHRWVALLTAGIDGWHRAGVLDSQRIWTCAKGVYSAAVAEYAAAAVLGTVRRLFESDRCREWQRLPGRRMSSTTIVIVGTGTIGRALAKQLAPFRPHIVGVNRSGHRPPGFDRCVPDLPTALADADVVVLAAPLTSSTRRMINAETLAHLRTGAHLINVGRGELVDTDALTAALRSGIIGQAVLDVTDPEPLPKDHALWRLDNALITGHVANPNNGRPWDFHADEVTAHLSGNMRAFLAGTPLAGTVELDPPPSGPRAPEQTPASEKAR